MTQFTDEDLRRCEEYWTNVRIARLLMWLGIVIVVQTVIIGYLLLR